MPMPVVATLTGTAVLTWTPDWMQAPFEVGIGLVTNTSGVNGTAILEYALQSPNAVDINGTATPTWFPLIALTGANATANFTTPCQALRVTIATATATSSWTVHFVQATFPR